MLRRLGGFVLLTFVFLLPVQAQEGDKITSWTPSASFSLNKIGHVQPSPDGKRVVYTVTAALAPKLAAIDETHIWVANSDGTGAMALTKGAKKHSDPHWSPDGQWIAYLKSGDLYRMKPDGSDSEVLTQEAVTKKGNQEQVVSALKWSPDGKAIAFTARDTPKQKDFTSPKAPRVVDGDIANDRLCVVALTKGADGKYPITKLTGSDYHVGPGRVGTGSFDWSPDSKQIAFTKIKSSRPDDWPSADIWLATVASGTLSPLAATEAAEANPLFSPDGKYVACTVSSVPVTWSRKIRVQVIPVKGEVKTPKVLAVTPDDEPTLMSWSEDGSKIFFTEKHRTAAHVFALPLDGPPVMLTKGDIVVGDINPNATRTMLGFTVQDTRTPQEAFVSKIDAFTPVQVSKLNVELAKLPIAKTEVVRWKGPGGMEIEGLLTYPANYEAGKRYPLLLNIHGGPTGVFSQTFLANPSPYPLATFADKGYAVLRPNPRGSGGYGATFRAANHKDWGVGDFKDLMAGVDHVIGLGIADEKRLGVMGWSYGGYMTSWTITQTKRFKAASVGAGVTNLVSFTGTTDINSFLPSHFGGEFWDNPGLYEKHSAMFHVKNVTTPTLIQHGDADDRVPISQGYELYNALKRQRCTCEMVVYPGAKHGLGSSHMLDAMQRNLAWMDKYVK
jgi:dipeptidyl aminopeptidase/acylaminoacyl peptidase